MINKIFQNDNSNKAGSNFKLFEGDCLNILKNFEDNYFSAIVTDPPYGIRFMNSKWDYKIPSIEVWKELLRVIKPGGFLLSFGGTRTQHRLTCNIEDAGWEIRDCLMWIFGSGFPKSHNISKAIDTKLGKVRKVIGVYKTPEGGQELKTYNNWQDSNLRDNKQEKRHPLLTESVSEEAKLWDGYGTALKPAYEPIIVAFKPIEGTFAENALKWGCGGLNIDGCRIESSGETLKGGVTDGFNFNDRRGEKWKRYWKDNPEKYNKLKAEQCLKQDKAEMLGRWPSNIILDEEAGKQLDKQTGILKSGKVEKYHKQSGNSIIGTFKIRERTGEVRGYGDRGGASRYFKQIKGRWPSNIILDKEAGKQLDKQTGDKPSASEKYGGRGGKTAFFKSCKNSIFYSPLGISSHNGPSRFFIVQKLLQKKEENIINTQL